MPCFRGKVQSVGIGTEISHNFNRKCFLHVLYYPGRVLGMKLFVLAISSVVTMRLLSHL